MSVVCAKPLISQTKLSFFPSFSLSHQTYLLSEHEDFWPYTSSDVHLSAVVANSTTEEARHTNNAAAEDMLVFCVCFVMKVCLLKGT